MSGQTAEDVVAMFKGSVAVTHRVEHAYYALVGKLPLFMDIWGRNKVWCIIDENVNLLWFSPILMQMFTNEHAILNVI